MEKKDTATIEVYTLLGEEDKKLINKHAIYSKVIIYTMLKNKQKTEIESSGNSEGIENVLV